MRGSTIFFRGVVGWFFHRKKKGEREHLLSNIEKLIYGTKTPLYTLQQYA
jgi:hypothetical protein